MTIEEKAKRYDETIEKLRDFYRDYDIVSSLIDVKEELANLIPELKEPEDERIRKMLINQMERWHKVALENNVVQDVKDSADAISWLEEQGKLKNYDEAEKEKTDFVDDGFIKCYADFLDFKKGNTYWLEYIGDDKYNVRSDNLLGKTYHITPCQLYTVFKKLSWLEKEGELKPVNKIEPKFHEGEWVVYNNDICQIVKREEGCNKFALSLVTVLGIEKELANERNLSTARLWTINDAKDGDVLYSVGCHENCVFIFDRLDNWKFAEPNGERAVATGYCCLTFSGGNMEFGIGGPDCIEFNTVKPATKEQRDLLFTKMKEAGYEWDAKKKELKKIKDEEYNEEDGIAVKKLYKQKPTEWSEEDEYCIHQLIVFCENCMIPDSGAKRCAHWLKSLKGRVLSQPKQEWSEEDEKMLNSFLHKAEVCDLLTNKEYRWIVNNLKSLRPLNTWKPSDLPHWKKSTLPNDNSTGFNSDYFLYNGYNINYKELFEKLPKDD